MPMAIIIDLQAAAEGGMPINGGVGVHGWWFGCWRSFRPSVAERLHRPNQPAPFTLSGIMGLAAGKPIAAGESGWLRITSLDEELDDCLPDWLAALPERAEIQGQTWQLKVRASAHDWAGRATYTELQAQLLDFNPPSRWQVELASPTAFNGKKAQFPYPLPELMVRSWWERWNAFAPIALSEEYVQAAREDLATGGYRLHTQTLNEGPRRVTGCVGMAWWRAVDMPPELRAGLNLLCAYAFYCGTGYHTTQGMGMTRISAQVR